MVTRRNVLLTAAALSASSVIRATVPARQLLILGGTGFIGPHLTTEAQRLGWTVTHFNRGKTASEPMPQVRTLIGDRKGQLDALKGGAWDAVVDDTGYVPRFVRQSNALLAPSTAYFLYISSISAYADLAQPVDEDSPLGKLDNPDEEAITEKTYGPMKALCEQYVREDFKGKPFSIVRPGYVVGPGDTTDRFTYWPVRASRGGEMLAPGNAHDPIQFIDVRDLAALLMRLVESRTSGTFNALSAPGQLSMGELIRDCQDASPKAGTTVTWVPEDFLAAHAKLSDLSLAPWDPQKGADAYVAQVANKRATAAGLRIRPMDLSVRDTLAWFQTLPAERQGKLRAGLEPKLEADILAEWHRSGAKS